MEKFGIAVPCQAYNVDKSSRKGVPMKFRWLAITVALAAFSAVPWTSAQVSDPDKDQPKAGDVQNTPDTANKPPVVLPSQDDSQIKHNGGKTDVDAVGNWYSVEGQVAMGRRFAQQVEAQVKLVNDPVVTEYVNRVGQNLVRNSDAQVPFT